MLLNISSNSANAFLIILISYFKQPHSTESTCLHVFKIAQVVWAGVPGERGAFGVFILAVTPNPPCNLHPVMAHAALAPLLIPEPYCSLFVFSSFFPWAPGQWEEKVTVNIALKSSLAPSHRAPEDGTGDQWVSTSFLRRAFQTVRHQTSANPSMSKIAAVRSCARCWHYNNLGRSLLLVKISR